MSVDEEVIDLPDVLAEVRAAFERYERALVSNDIGVLDELFWPDPRVQRFGIGENLYGIEAIREFRQGRPAAGLARRLERTEIHTFGRDVAVANTEFYRDDRRRCGRQSQTWVRLAAGWRIVSAHVSVIEAPPGAGPGC
jgi:hypothetical protein